MIPVIAVAILISVSTMVQAQSFYKCTQDGKVTWQDRACDGASSNPVDVQPANGSVRPVPPVNWSREEMKLADRQRARGVESQRLQSEHRAFVEQCRSLTEEAERERAWKHSISMAVRESSAIRVQQLEKRAQDMNCPY